MQLKESTITTSNERGQEGHNSPDDKSL